MAAAHLAAAKEPSSRRTPLGAQQASAKRRGSVFRQASAQMQGQYAKDGVRGMVNSHDDEASRKGVSAYWEALWQDGVGRGERFDGGGPCLALVAHLEATGRQYERGLVPGCGRGYDARALAKACSSVVGLDLAPTAISNAEAYEEQAAAEEAARGEAPRVIDFRRGNFFELDEGGGFDVIFDCTFLCALHPAARPAWAKKVADLVKPGGDVISLVFPLDTTYMASILQFARYYTAGPPYSLTVDLVEDLLRPHGFTKTAVQNPLPPDLAHLPNNPLGCGSAFAVFTKALDPTDLPA